jgi:hypothetical protein
MTALTRDRRTSKVRCAVCLLLALGTSKPLLAQDEAVAGFPVDSGSTEAPDSPEESPTEQPPQKKLVDVGDLWRHLRGKTAPPQDQATALSARKPFFFVSPSVSAKPSTGLAVGLASSIVFVHGDPATTKISSADASVSDSTKGQAGTSFRFRVFMADNRWFIQGDNRLAWSSQETYPLGVIDAPGEKLKYDRLRFYDAAFLQVKRKFFVGFGLNVNTHNDVRPAEDNSPTFPYSAYVKYTTAAGYPLEGQVSSGLNVAMFVDTRDNTINASRGWLASATYRTFFDGFLGGNATWQLLSTDVRTYKTLTRDGRQKVAFWFLSETVTGGVAPYLDLPAIAEDTYGRSARGYTTSRYRGPHLMYGEVEYRTTLSRNGLFGAVAFANATSVDSGLPGQEIGTVVPAGGGGIRVLLSKRSRANLCLDYGWGIEGSRGIYLAVRETF